MGICTDKGETFERTCRACSEKVKIISTGEDVWCCPYCGHTLMDHETSDFELEQSLGRVHAELIRFRSEKGEEQRECLKPRLQAALQSLKDDLEYHGKDLSRFHRWFCLKCNWTGLHPSVVISGENQGKAVCPNCKGFAEERIHYTK